MENTYIIDIYFNYGRCIDIFTPGNVHYANFDYYNDSSDVCIDDASMDGTSCSEPLVAGVAALIMSENPNIDYTNKSMRRALIKLSLKNVLKNVPEDTPNRFLNNGKKIVYSPRKTYNGYGILSGNLKYLNGCCLKDSDCTTLSELCHIDNGCQSEFGKCEY